TKPARSPTVTGVLPMRLATSVTSSTVSRLVETVVITSASFMTGAGLKKCSPTTLSGRPVSAAISVTDNEDVLVAKIVPGGQILSRSPKTSCLMFMCSGTASTTKSASERSSREVVKVRRASIAARSSSLSFPLPTARESDLSTWPRPRSHASWSLSTPTTLKPARANTSAIPAPIVPSPTTPTLSNSCTMGSTLEGTRCVFAYTSAEKVRIFPGKPQSTGVHLFTFQRWDKDLFRHVLTSSSVRRPKDRTNILACCARVGRLWTRAPVPQGLWGRYRALRAPGHRAVQCLLRRPAHHASAHGSPAHPPQGQREPVRPCRRSGLHSVELEAPT